MPAQTNKPDQSLTSDARAELAEQRLAEALQQLEQERQRSRAMAAKLQELNVSLDFLQTVGSSVENLANTCESTVESNPDNSVSASKTPLIHRIYTDGACSGNPGPGGWGVVVYFADKSVHELGGADRHTTNNRMEMQAAIAALRWYKESGQVEPIELYTDSEYVLKGITEWIKGWKRKGWKNSKGKPVENQDLWQVMDLLNSPSVQWRHVRGHSGDVGNDRCDEIARTFSLGKTPMLRQKM